MEMIGVLIAGHSESDVKGDFDYRDLLEGVVGCAFRQYSDEVGEMLVVALLRLPESEFAQSVENELSAT